MLLGHWKFLAEPLRDKDEIVYAEQNRQELIAWRVS